MAMNNVNEKIMADYIKLCDKISVGWLQKNGTVEGVALNFNDLPVYRLTIATSLWLKCFDKLQFFAQNGRRSLRNPDFRMYDLDHTTEGGLVLLDEDNDACREKVHQFIKNIRGIKAMDNKHLMDQVKEIYRSTGEGCWQT